jgi:hypothetical protein
MQALIPELAADSRAFVSTDRQILAIVRGCLVHCHGPCFEGLCNAYGTVDVAREYTSIKAVYGIVGSPDNVLFIRKRGDA